MIKSHLITLLLIAGLLPKNREQVGNEAIRKTLSEPDSVEMTRPDRPETFIHYLRQNGWHTVGIGKISHYSDGYLYGYNQPQGTALELANSWDEWMLETGSWGTGWNAFFGYADGTNRNTLNNQVKPYECSDVTDNAYPDGLMADRIIHKLNELKKTPPLDKGGAGVGKPKPFLLAVGFFRPHLPFNAPKKYWDRYDEDSIPLSPLPNLPEGVNRESLHQSGEFNSYRLGDEAASLDIPLSDPYARKIRHAYFAAISYVDAQIGKVLDELERLGLDKNTIVVVWGDHGWHLGDTRVWGKHTLFEWALRSTLIMKIPEMSGGDVTNQIVSTVDIYPTLMELCGLEMPYEGDGKSLVPLFSNPNPGDWSGKALGFYNRGFTLRTDRYRLTLYNRNAQPVVELVDQQKDPIDCRNIALDFPALVDSLKNTSGGKKGQELLNLIWQQ